MKQALLSFMVCRGNYYYFLKTWVLSRIYCWFSQNQYPFFRLIKRIPMNNIIDFYVDVLGYCFVLFSTLIA